MSVVAFLVTWMIWTRPSWYLAADSGSLSATLLTFQASWCILAFLYESTFLLLCGRTPGKFLRQLRVISSEHGRMLRASSAITRSLLPTALLVALIALTRGGGDREMYVAFQIMANWLIGAALMGLLLLDRRRQGPHDKAARTLVVIEPTRDGELLDDHRHSGA